MSTYVMYWKLNYRTCFAKNISCTRESFTRLPWGFSSWTHLKRKIKPKLEMHYQDSEKCLETLISFSYHKRVSTPWIVPRLSCRFLRPELLWHLRKWIKWNQYSFSNNNWFQLVSLPNFWMSSVNTPGSLSIKHQLPAPESPMLFSVSCYLSLHSYGWPIFRNFHKL